MCGTHDLVFEVGCDYLYDLGMAKWTFPPGWSPDELMQRMKELSAENEPPVADQHVVSKVILKCFAEQGAGSSQWQLGRYDLDLGKALKARGVAGCGKSDRFLRYATASAERLWKEVENRLGDAISAARSGRLTDGERGVLRDAIALHFIRSLKYLEIHEAIARSTLVELERSVPRLYGDRLEREFARQHGGLRPAGPEALRLAAEPALRPWREATDSGLLARAKMEEMYMRTRTSFDHLGLEVLHAPPDSFLISDSPAVAYNHGTGGPPRVVQALGDSHCVVMPVAHDCLVAISDADRDGTVDPSKIAMLNSLQIAAAQRYFFYKPGTLQERGLAQAFSARKKRVESDA